MNKENDMNPSLSHLNAPSAKPLVHFYPYKTKDGRYFAVSLIQDGNCAPALSDLFDSFGALQRDAASKWPNRKWHPIQKDSF